jgi:hypothetical protein
VAEMQIVIEAIRLKSDDSRGLVRCNKINNEINIFDSTPVIEGLQNILRGCALG